MHIRLGRGDAPRGWLCLKMVWGRVWSRRAGRSTGYRAGCRVSNATDLLGLKRSLCCCPGTFLASQTPTVRVFHYHCHPAALQPAAAHLSPSPTQPSRERWQHPPVDLPELPVAPHRLIGSSGGGSMCHMFN